ncbi:hypothetical protein HYV74_04665 [Candidatus Uhrbacteria bacterium]|nr:hypothetical protein [Candidatus Uhrbacteria bacterium]
MIETLVSELVGQLLVDPVIRWPGALVIWMMKGGRTSFWKEEVARHPRRNLLVGMGLDVGILAVVAWYFL